MTVVTGPGIYDLSNDHYHSDPCPEPSLSSSVGKVLDQGTPYHAFWDHPRFNPKREPEEAEKFDIGNAAHSLVLHDPKKFAILGFKDYRTKDAKGERDEARADGRIPLLLEQWERVLAMSVALKAQLAVHQDAADAFTDGKPEVTIVWQEVIDGFAIWCRSKLDWMPNSRKTFDDYKTTEAFANPDSYPRTMFNVGHDFQAAFYRRGLRKLEIARNPIFRFIVQETFEPHLMAAIELENYALELADRRVEMAMRKWAWCLRNKVWPGYPNRTCRVSVPEWVERQQMERETRNEETAKNLKVDRDLLALGMRMQAPPTPDEEPF